jgi:hypothetical protein
VGHAARGTKAAVVRGGEKGNKGDEIISSCRYQQQQFLSLNRSIAVKKGGCGKKAQDGENARSSLVKEFLVGGVR